ncbi:MAG: DUF3298 and DUF4163 domain-containing protein [Clostridia bacterium]|nr:DUF3298 and DUF4163 domain-containing protein [Clostridia bacterium]
MDTTKFPVQIVTHRLVRPNLDVYYPAVTGLGIPAVHQRINTAIFNLVQKLISDQGYYQNPQMQVTGYYELKTNERGILSLDMENYAYAPMAAHGLTVIKSLTFDTQTGKQYQLGELFKPGSNYVKVLSDIIQKQITQRQVPLLTEFTQIAPNQDYYIADKTLVVYFQLYELTPYVYGFPMFPISVYDLQDIITDNGPLGRMATNG